MKFARCDVDGETVYGVIEGDLVRRITATPFEEYEMTDHCNYLREIKLLAPSTPSKILAMAFNVKSHLGDRQAPTEPQPFLKTPSSVIGTGDTILLPKNAVRVEEEGELVVVIGRRCSKVSQADALRYVLGYTCGNDVSARVWQREDNQWWRAKSSDTFSPVGPYITTDLDAFNFEIQARINGSEVQHCYSSELLFDIPTIISFISQVMTLQPGDLIFTGTSGRPAELHDGDVVEVEVPGIGTLRNPVKAE